jgi:hypothetical protein
MAVVNLAHMILSTLRLAYVLEPNSQGPHAFDHCLFALSLVCLLDMTLVFHTGFVEASTSVILDKTTIAW